MLEVRGDQALVISKCGLDCKQYNTIQTDVSWETCSLREWLNGTFLNSAFSMEEQEAIASTIVDNSIEQGSSEQKTWNTGGVNTEDRVFLLSYAEACGYFSSDSARQCQGTKYAEANGAFMIDRYCGWWLRSAGVIQLFAVHTLPVSAIAEYTCAFL